jgi:hypothetical protein
MHWAGARQAAEIGGALSAEALAERRRVAAAEA